ncbi:putative zinc-type alcohol dehydrogenase-like protein PB24D3.08c [Dissophora ornata]|nr:hypothetical protein BGZ58_007553 [Dissophora ornata]KAI8598499.1 putative zinc-type alcohol dehydrogenase-like protein PB24D3.08c [Dissophora ornata]
MVKSSNKAIVFLKTPDKYPIAGEHLGFVEAKELDQDLNDNEVLVRNLYISLDPYLRHRMQDTAPAYTSRFTVGQPIENYGVGEVVASKNRRIPAGSIVVGFLGWEEYTRVHDSNSVTIIEGARESKIPLSFYVGVLGMPGFTAYSSFFEIGKPKAGETIFISAASGAVGQVVGQLAKLKGLRVIGSAGSDDKVEYLLKTLKFDAAFNYKKGNILESLRAAAPEGIDIYYENVGGETLEAALEVFNNHGRIVVCGMISSYNAVTPYGVKNLFQVVAKRLKMEGFIVNDYSDEVRERFEKEVKAWLLEGKIVYKEDITVGLENATEAFVGMLQGKNFGKAVVEIADL